MSVCRASEMWAAVSVRECDMWKENRGFRRLSWSGLTWVGGGWAGLGWHGVGCGCAGLGWGVAGQ